MATNLDTTVALSKESVYGTWVAPTRGFEAQADDFKAEISYLNSTGFRKGLSAKSATRSKPVEMGGTGTLQLDFLDAGMGFFLQGMFTSEDGDYDEAPPVMIGQRWKTGTDAPNATYSFQIQRITTAGAVHSFSSPGGVITGWSLNQDVDDFLKLNLNLDFQKTETNKSTVASPTYSTGDPFDWTMANVKLGGNDFCVNSFSLEADLGLKTDRRGLCGADGYKKRPIRNALPAYTGSMAADFDGMTIYNLYMSGAPTSVEIKWENSAGDSLTILMPAVQITSDTPEASLDELTSQPITYEALDNGTDPVITCTYKNSDVAL